MRNSTGLNSDFFLLHQLSYQTDKSQFSQSIDCCWENRWIRIFPKGITATYDSNRISDSISYDDNLHHNFSMTAARGVMVIVVENGQGNTSSNPGRDW